MLDKPNRMKRYTVSSKFEIFTSRRRCVTNFFVTSQADEVFEELGTEVVESAKLW